MPSRLFISIDDTDTEGGEGTGRLARKLVEELNLDVLGITRHQLYLHPSINYTKRNSCNVIILMGDPDVREDVEEVIVKRSERDSDPGLAIASIVPQSIRVFGMRAQRRVMSKEEAVSLARRTGVYLEELGGSGQGVIGALAGLGLCSTGNDGRYIMLPRLREMNGKVSVNELKEMGIVVFNLSEARVLEDGEVALSNTMRPSRVNGRPYLFVEEEMGLFYPLKL